jgi:hypothetical protein
MEKTLQKDSPLIEVRDGDEFNYELAIQGYGVSREYDFEGRWLEDKSSVMEMLLAEENKVV